MMYEIYKQLQGKAEQRQKKDVKLGLTHSLGGQPPQSVCSVCIVGAENSR
jgi:acetyl-CoA C-acetyltransferase